MNQRERASEGERWRGRENILFFFFLNFFLRFMKIGHQVFIGTKGKVDLRDESYACKTREILIS